MWDIILGLVAMIFGLLLVFSGLRYFFAALPILGFFFGFIVGGAGVHAVLGDGIFSTLTSWIVGLVLGLIFALVSYFWWYLGALIAAGSTGALLGTSLVRAFGSSAEWLILIFAIVGFIAGFVFAMALSLPVYIVLVNTAFAGATVVVTGLMMVIDKVDRADLGYGNAVATINESWWWTIPVVALAIVGIFSQLKSVASVKLPEERWTTASTI